MCGVTRVETREMIADPALEEGVHPRARTHSESATAARLREDFTRVGGGSPRLYSPYRGSRK